MRKWQIMRNAGGAALLGTFVALTGCGGGGSNPPPTGTVNVAFTDAPSSDFDKVWVTVRAIRFHTSDTAAADDGGWLTYQLPQPVTLDLAALNHISDYWEAVREYYYPFEEGIKVVTHPPTSRKLGMSSRFHSSWKMCV